MKYEIDDGYRGKKLVVKSEWTDEFLSVMRAKRAIEVLRPFVK